MPACSLWQNSYPVRGRSARQRFQEGITVAAIRWMNVHTDNSWRPHNIPDTHNSTTGNYGGMFIMPEPIAVNIYALMDNRTANSKNK